MFFLVKKLNFFDESIINTENVLKHDHSNHTDQLILMREIIIMVVVVGHQVRLCVATSLAKPQQDDITVAISSIALKHIWT
jgi:hypothetical protein